MSKSNNAADSLSRRLQKELLELMTSDSGDGATAFPDGESLATWTATLRGPDGTPYEGDVYKLSLEFPADYPFRGPAVRFTTPCYHPNVDQFGNICLDILRDKWTALYTVRTVLLSIRALLGDPNNSSPLNAAAAAQWPNPAQFVQAKRAFQDDNKRTGQLYSGEP